MNTPRYLRPRRAGGRERGLAWLLIAGLHLAVLAGLSMAGVGLPLPKAPQTLMVSFITEQPPAVEPPKPPSPPPPRPELPRMVATPRPTPSTMEAVAPDQPPAPVEAAPPAAEPGPAVPEPVVVPPNFSAAHLNNPGPQVPYQSRKLGEQGTVWLRVLVDPEGRPQQVRVDRSSGYARLDEAAVEVVTVRWRFVAARRGDEAVAAWVLVPISFERSNR